MAIAPFRRRERRDVERIMQRRLGGHGGSAIVDVVGAPGSGKSALLTELAWGAQLSGADVARADRAANGLPGGVLAACLHEIAALDGTEPPGVGAEANPRGRALGIAGWLAAHAETCPVVLVLDDVDDHSRELSALVAALLPDEARVCVVRSGLEFLGPRVGIGAVPAVELEPLSPAAVDQWLATVMGRREFRLAARLHKYTGGHIGHLRAAFLYLAERGFPSAEKLDAIALPPGLEESYRRRISQLDEQEHAGAVALAILGRPASEVEVRAIGGADARVPEELCRRDRWGRVQLRAAPIGSQVLGELDAERRRELERAAARATRGAEATEHYVRAGCVDEAKQRAPAAIAELWQRGDARAAVALGTAAVELLSDASLALRVGEMAQVSGNFRAARSLLTPLEAEPRAQLVLARADAATGRLEEADARLSPLVEAGGELSAESARELVELRIRRGMLAGALEVADAQLEKRSSGAGHDQLALARAFVRGSLQSDEGALQQIAAVAERAGERGDLNIRAAARYYAARTAFAAGDYKAAQANYEGALADAEAIGDLARAGLLRMNLAAMDYSFGEWGRSRRRYEVALSLLRGAGLITLEVVAQRNVGHLFVEIGAYEQARTELTAARARASELGLEVHEIGIGALFGLIDWRTGDLAGGRRRLQEARRAFEGRGDQRRMAETVLDIAELELDAAARAPERLDDADSALRSLTGSPAVERDGARRARFEVLSAQVIARRGDHEAAASALRRFQAAFEELAKQSSKQLAWDLLRRGAQVWEELGDGVRASSMRRQAIDIATAIAEGLSAADRVAYWQDPRRAELRHRSGFDSERSGFRGGTGIDGVERLYRLLEIYRQLSQERDVDRLLGRVMETAMDLFAAERGFLLVAEEGGDLVTAAARNLPDQTLRLFRRVDSDRTSRASVDVPYSRSVAEEVFATGNPVVTGDAASDPRFGTAQSVHARDIGGVVCVPVRAGGRVVGALYLEGPLAAGRESDEDLRLLMAFGDQAAVLLESARMLAENQRRADELDEAQREIEGLLDERTRLLEERTAELATAERDLAEVRRRFLGESGAFGIIGRSSEMERVFSLIDRLADSDVPVLVRGESGTGKELVARALHQHGRRNGARLVSVNCGALPEMLLESELFGHVKGAFTGADRDRRGLFEVASGGTLFLDEVGEMSPRMQASLLRALQEKVIRPVGGIDDVAVDVRVIAATHRDLEAMVKEGTYRQDLYFRLNVVTVQVPPLRDRVSDIPLLVDHFLARIAPGKRISARALKALSGYPWPGNVRQLEHALTSAAIMADADLLDFAAFEVLREPPRSRAAAPTPNQRASEEKERIIAALEAQGWNKSEAARSLGMPRRTFYRRLKHYDIQ